MIEDVSPLALAARRLDVSATLRAFLAFGVLVFAVLGASAAVGATAFNYGSSLAYGLLAVSAGVLFALGFGPGLAAAWSSPSIPGWRRASAIAAATLTLFALSGLITAGFVDRPVFFQAVGIALVGLALCAYVWLSPTLALISDDLVRRPLRWVSRAIATSVGAIAWAVVGLALATLIAFAGEAAFDAGLRQDLMSEVGYVFDDLVDDWRYTGPNERVAFVLAAPLVLLIYVALPLWLLRRTWQVERELAKPTPRAVLVGDVSGQGFFGRLGYQFGLPSSMWRGSAIAAPSTWLFLFARPFAYAPILVVSNAQAFQGLNFAAEELVYDLSDRFFDGQAEGAIGVGLLIAALVAPVLLGHVMFALGKRLASRRVWAEDGAGAAGADPVLFLRSFTDDRFNFRRPWRDIFGRWLDLWAFRRTADEVLIDEFAKDGPVLALGKPGDKRAPFGAARRFASHDDWQAVIETTATRARAIVIAAGETPGLMWEYALIARANHFAKTIVLFPPDPKRRDAALARFREAYPDASPAPSEPGRGVVAWRRGADGERWIVADRPRAQAYLVALRRFMLERAEARGETANPYLFTQAAFRPLRRLIPVAIAALVALAAWFWWEELDGEYVVEDSIDWLADKGGVIGAIVGAEPELYTPPPLPPPPPAPAPEAYQFQPGERVATIYFETRSSILTADGWSLVAQIVQELQRQAPTAVFEVIGHVDAAEAAHDTASGGDTLASARAQAVRDALIASGAPADRFSVRAAGSREPDIANVEGVSEPLNRRVTVIAAYTS